MSATSLIASGPLVSDAVDTSTRLMNLGPYQGCHNPHHHGMFRECQESKAALIGLAGARRRFKKYFEHHL